MSEVKSNSSCGGRVACFPGTPRKHAWRAGTPLIRNSKTASARAALESNPRPVSTDPPPSPRRMPRSTSATVQAARPIPREPGLRGCSRSSRGSCRTRADRDHRRRRAARIDRPRLCGPGRHRRRCKSAADRTEQHTCTEFTVRVVRLAIQLRTYPTTAKNGLKPEPRAVVG